MAHKRFSRSTAWPVVLLALICLIYSGFARIAHVHRLDVNDQNAPHVECALCVDANHWAVPPALHQSPVFRVAWVITIPRTVIGRSPRILPCFYDARGPPHV